MQAGGAAVCSPTDHAPPQALLRAQLRPQAAPCMHPAMALQVRKPRASAGGTARSSKWWVARKAAKRGSAAPRLPIACQPPRRAARLYVYTLVDAQHALLSRNLRPASSLWPADRIVLPRGDQSLLMAFQRAQHDLVAALESGRPAALPPAVEALCAARASTPYAQQVLLPEVPDALAAALRSRRGRGEFVLAVVKDVLVHLVLKFTDDTQAAHSLPEVIVAHAPLMRCAARSATVRASHPGAADRALAAERRQGPAARVKA